MKTNTFILLAAAIATLGIAACEREEEPMGSPSGVVDTIPAVDTIPTIDTTPAHPWYQSLVGTRWFCHDDCVLVPFNSRDIFDRYWDIVDDSTVHFTNYWIEMNGIPMNDTIMGSFKYSYNPDELKFIHYYPGGDVEVAYLDTVQKTLSVELPPEFEPNHQIYYLIED